jgi:hypothetical protein
MFYSLSVFNRRGACVYFSEWNRPPSDAQKIAEDQHLLYGMLWSMKLFCAKMSPDDATTAAGTGRTELHCFRTSGYKLHYYESGTGVKLVAITDPATPDLHETLAALYRDVYVECVVKNPFVPLHDPAAATTATATATVDHPINCDLFSDTLAKFVKQLPCFK